jgi:hypothetical protein
MIIKIEDAPNIKHIKIDINFDDDAPNVSIDTEKLESETLLTPRSPKTSILDDIALDTDADFSVSEEVVEKPEIPDTDREVKVSDDMVDATF